MNKRRYYQFFSFLIVCSMLVACSKVDNRLRLIQIDPQSYSQMMGYILTDGDTTIIVDGGASDTTDYFLDLIEEIGDTTIEGWYLTHYHNDHAGVLNNLLNDNTSNLTIENIYYNFPEGDWVKKNEAHRFDDYINISTSLKTVENKEIVKKSNVINYDKFSVKTLRTFDANIVENAGNNSSSIYRVTLKKDNQSILFLGDLGVEGEKELLLNPEEITNMDYVQMAHHGQAGVSKEFYTLVNPKYCLWPTPDWLYENKENAYKTDETKKWIKDLNVLKEYIAKDGLLTIYFD